MRKALPVMLLAAAAVAFAQAPADRADGACRVSTGALVVNDQGELVQPPPTAEDCAAADTIIDKLLSKERGDFRRVTELEPIPGNVRVHVGRIAPYGRPWNASNIPSDLPNRRHRVSWLTKDIVVVVYESADFAGPTTTVVIADLETGQVCNYPRWPESDRPAAISIDEIKRLLERARRGAADAPVCNLKPLTID